MTNSFHLCFPVRDVDEAERFYCQILGFKRGRKSSTAIVINMAGNQVVARLDKNQIAIQKSIYPFHFGLIFESLSELKVLSENAEKANCIFYQDKRMRVRNNEAYIENRNFFIKDPSGNWLEFKWYKNADSALGANWIKRVGE